VNFLAGVSLAKRYVHPAGATFTAKALALGIGIAITDINNPIDKKNRFIRTALG
jgi:hypothetical protein